MNLLLTGEKAEFNRLAGGLIATDIVPMTADGVICAGNCIYLGYIVIVSPSANIVVRFSAYGPFGTGVRVPSGRAIGRYLFPVGIPANGGLHADFEGTGTVNFIFARQQ
jgi:hypothetical protein